MQWTAGFDEDSFYAIRPVIEYLSYKEQPLEWLDEQETALLAEAFRCKRADRMDTLYRTGCGRLREFVAGIGLRPTDPPEERDVRAFNACFFNSSVFQALWNAGYLARAAELFREKGIWIEAGLLENAVSVGNAQAVRILLEAGADPNKRFENGYTALYTACRSTPDIGLASLLLEYGAKANGRTSFGMTALFGAVENKNEAVVDLLLEHGARIDVKTHCRGETLLHYAAMLSSAAIVEKLLRRGADMDARDRTGKTPLHYAAERGNAGNVEALILGGAKIHVCNRDGSYPLRAAAKRGRYGVVKALLEYGALGFVDGGMWEDLLGMARHMRRYFPDNKFERAGIVAMLEAAMGGGDDGGGEGFGC